MYFRLVITLGYYGLSLNVGRIGGNVYINFFSSIVVEIVGYSACLLLMDRIGRKLLLCGSMTLGGVACLLTIFTSLYADKCKYIFYVSCQNGN